MLRRYVLKSQMKELLELEAKNAISIEEEIEIERKKVDAKTPITEEASLIQLLAFIGSLSTGHCSAQPMSLHTLICPPSVLRGAQ